MKWLGNICYGLFIVAFLGVTGLFLATLLPIPNNIEIKIVKSGSMEPTILTGSIVVIKPQASYAIGDTVTFGADTKEEIPTTHRIIATRIDNGVTWFSTKGDANEEADPQMIRADQVIGKVLVAVPYAGYILDFARQPVGFTFMIGIPAGLLILDELATIYKELRRSRRKRDDEDENNSHAAPREEITYTRARAMDDVFVPMYMSVAHTTPVRMESRTGKRFMAAFAMYFIFVLTISDTAGATVSYFADTDTSDGNVLVARELDFTVDAGETTATSIAIGDELHFTTSFMATAGSLPTAYRVVAEKISGAEPFCSLLQAEATSTPAYAGSLVNLLTGTTTEEIDAWHVLVTLPDATGVVADDMCAIDLIYQGWYLLNGQWGYSDEERVNLEFTYEEGGEIVIEPPPLPPDIVLNEFLPNPDDEANGLNFGNDSADMPLGEWVELFNNDNVPHDIAGWYIADESGGIGNQQAVISGANTQSATTIIPAQGWLVVYFNKPVLNNTGDSIFLYTDADVLVDSYTYDNPSDFCENEPTPTEGNVDTSATGDCLDNQVAPNKSYARIPDGLGSFVDPIPTPGAQNIPDPDPVATEEPSVAAPENEEDELVEETPPAGPVFTDEIRSAYGGGSGSSSQKPSGPAAEDEKPEDSEENTSGGDGEDDAVLAGETVPENDEAATKTEAETTVSEEPTEVVEVSPENTPEEQSESTSGVEETPVESDVGSSEEASSSEEATEVVSETPPVEPAPEPPAPELPPAVEPTPPPVPEPPPAPAPTEPPPETPDT